MDVFVGITAGSTLKVVYSIEPTAEYHQMRLSTGNWSYFTDPINFSENGEYALTPVSYTHLKQVNTAIHYGPSVAAHEQQYYKANVANSRCV